MKKALCLFNAYVQQEGPKYTYERMKEEFAKLGVVLEWKTNSEILSYLDQNGSFCGLDLSAYAFCLYLDKDKYISYLLEKRGLRLFNSAESIRLYAMPRIRNCKITNDKFSIPKDFKLELHIDVQMGAWGNSGEKFKVELEFVKGLKTYVMERTWHKGQTIKENKDGSVYLSFETNQLGQTASWIMSFTGGAKVLNPPELRVLVKEAAARILKQY